MIQGCSDSTVPQVPEMVGECPAMLEVYAMIRKVAACNVSVLVQGESGTGKEMVARAIWSMSARRDLPFVAINVSALPETLLEAELFGHEKGAFTGAHVKVQGKFEFADSGTLFLDEIGELPATLQVKLLRFLQEKTLQRVGGREDISVDTRILSATSVDIERAIEEGAFRDDLYYRIGVITIVLPPLRDRGKDIVSLAEHFLQKFRNRAGKNIVGLEDAALDLIQSHNWPGNVRELENRILRAIIMTDSQRIRPGDLGIENNHFTLPPSNFDHMSLKEARDRIEVYMVLKAISKHEGNIATSAKALGISRPTLYHLLKKHGLQERVMNNSWEFQKSTFAAALSD